MDRLTRYRDGQLKRLKAFNDACATRLANMGKFKSFAKTVGKERRASLLDVSS
jgi:muconolactone delta-isomerase